MKEFTLDDLRAGKHVVETRDGKKYLVCIANKQLVGVGNGGRELLWQREAPKKMTVRDIQNILGYAVKIVEE